MSHDVEPLRGEWGDGAMGSAVEESFTEVVGETVLTELLVASAAECYLVLDEAGRIVFANPAVERVFGYEPEAIVNRPLGALIPDRLRSAHREGFEAYLRSDERTIDWDDVRFPGRHRDGSEFPLAMWFREFTYDDERYMVGVVRDISARVEQRDRLASEQAFVGSIFDALPDVLYAVDRDGQFLRWNETLTEVTGYTNDEVESLDPLDFIPEEDQRQVGTAIARVLEAGAVETVESALVTKDGEGIPYEFTGAPLVENETVVGLTGVARDVSERKRYRATLERLNDLNSVIRSVDRALVEATTREEITRAVCSRLVEQGAYCGAVIGSYGAEAGIAVDAAAGLGERMFGVLCPESELPAFAVRAAESRSVEVFEGVTGESGDGGFDDSRTVAAVPLAVDDQLFGLLGVCTEREASVSERERSVLGELGEGIGNAIQSALTRQLLHSDTVTEIELRTTDDGVAFVALSEAAECRLEVDRAVSFGDEHVFYVSAGDVSPERIRKAASSVPSVTSVEHLADDRFEFRSREGTISTVLTELGARTVAGVADRGQARIVAQLPADVPVRSAVDAVTAAYPDTELVGRQVTDQSLRTPEAFRETLAADLTEKQQAALEAAYFAGYFEWPARTSDAGAVAETLDIAPQTFHQHLRVAERKLLAALLEEPGHDSLD
ncbi:PAS domain S-box protein [Halosimplex salinum]|uniref:PAS domain S-box protein n=1 Tax=Halosimplex salinum TaxID=1710538 RepID=UPI0013DDDB03|nr:PAS domain S-box protein [Halosimplex salinum]